MQTVTIPAALTMPAPPVPAARAAVSLVVFSAAEHAWPDGAGFAPDAVQAARWLVSRSVPLVLVTRRGAADVLALQRELGVCHPFVSDGGASLYIPAGYFPELTRIGAERDGWNVVEFKPPHDTGHAVRLLASLYRLCGEDVVLVGLGDMWAYRALLHEVDVPVVVRSGTEDETRLLRSLPVAYLTNAPGAAGWTEAVLGSAGE